MGGLQTRKTSGIELLWVVPSFRVLSIRLPYYIWDLNRDPNLENYPCCGGIPFTRGAKLCRLASRDLRFSACVCLGFGFGYSACLGSLG